MKRAVVIDDQTGFLEYQIETKRYRRITTTGDGWSLQKLQADIADSAGALTPSGLAFTPSASKLYEVQARLVFQSANTGTGLQWCFGAPGGATWTTQNIQVPSSVISQAVRYGQLDVAALGAGVNSIAVQYLAMGTALLNMGASPTGQLEVLFNTETAGVAVTLLAGSFIRWRSIP